MFSEKIVICENDEGTIKCDMETDFVIVEANFGRTATDVCPSDNPVENANTDCVEPRTFSILHFICNAGYDELLTQCKLRPQDTYLFGIPCTDTKKYLEVTIDCQSTGINLPFIII